VDTETGHVNVLRMVNVADAGKPINPKICRTQLSGGAIMQLGFTLTEDMIFDGGQITNPSFADYKIPGFRDVPVMESELVTGDTRDGSRSAPKELASPRPLASRRQLPTRSKMPSVYG
jgi:CO/xanthine dehydrogenase Mo-binding subunit